MLRFKWLFLIYTQRNTEQIVKNFLHYFRFVLFFLINLRNVLTYKRA